MQVAAALQASLTLIASQVHSVALCGRHWATYLRVTGVTENCVFAQ